MALAFEKPIDQLVFIRGSKVLSDEELLEDKGITDGALVHLVFKTVPAQVIYNFM